MRNPAKAARKWRRAFTRARTIFYFECMIPAFPGMLNSPLSPAQITANEDEDDYNPTGLQTAGFLRLNSDAAWDITGITEPTIHTPGREMKITNINREVVPGGCTVEAFVDVRVGRGRRMFPCRCRGSFAPAENGETMYLMNLTAVQAGEEFPPARKKGKR